MPLVQERISDPPRSGSVRAPALVRYEPLRQPFIGDPYPAYASMRAANPVYWDRRFGWVVSRYADVFAALRDSRLSVQRPLPDDPIPRHLQGIARQVRDIRLMQSRWLLCADGSQHMRLRQALGGAFSPPMVERLRGRIQLMVDQLLDVIEARGENEMDVIDDLAYPLPSNIIADLLGVPIHDRGVFRRWSDDIAACSTWTAPALERAHSSQEALAEYLNELVAERRVRPADDLLSSLVAAERQGLLSEEEVVATCVLLLFVGHETTTNLIGNGTLALLRHPDQLQRLKSEPALIGAAVEELLRYDSPVQGAFRRATLDLQIGDQSVRQGEHVLLLLGAANHDADQFPNPASLDVGRGDKRHVSFGLGAHYCIGAILARLEGQVAIQSLFRRFPGMALAPTELEWRPNVLFRGVRHLPVVLSGSN